MRTTTPRPCSVADALSVIGEKWSLLVIREIALGSRRFDAIARNTGAPRDVLTNRLRRLEATGVVEKRQYQERPERLRVPPDAGRQGAPSDPAQPRPVGRALGRRSACAQLRAHVRPRARARPHLPRVRRRGQRRPRSDAALRAGLELGRSGRARSRVESAHGQGAFRAEPDGLVAPRRRAERRRESHVCGRARRHAAPPDRRHRRGAQRRGPGRRRSSPTSSGSGWAGTRGRCGRASGSSATARLRI